MRAATTLTRTARPRRSTILNESRPPWRHNPSKIASGETGAVHRPAIAPPSTSVLRRPFESTQYVCIRYTDRLLEAGIEPSVGSVGDSYDNALAETVIGLFKTEVIHRRGPWRSLDAVEYATLEWVDWYNHRRLLAPIGDMPPAEAEARYYEQLEPAALAA